MREEIGNVLSSANWPKKKKWRKIEKEQKKLYGCIWNLYDYVYYCLACRHSREKEKKENENIDEKSITFDRSIHSM